MINKKYLYITKYEDLNKWDKRFILLAKHISTWSKDPSTKVGAVIADVNNRIISVGFNGFAVGVPDRNEYLNDRNVKYKRVLHAELNACLFAKQDLDNCFMYVYPFPPCANCASVIIQKKIKRVLAPLPSKELAERWKDDLKQTYLLFGETKIKLVLIKGN